MRRPRPVFGVSGDAGVPRWRQSPPSSSTIRRQSDRVRTHQRRAAGSAGHMVLDPLDIRGAVVFPQRSRRRGAISWRRFHARLPTDQSLQVVPVGRVSTVLSGKILVFFRKYLIKDDNYLWQLLQSLDVTKMSPKNLKKLRKAISTLQCSLLQRIYTFRLCLFSKEIDLCQANLASEIRVSHFFVNFWLTASFKSV